VFSAGRDDLVGIPGATRPHSYEPRLEKLPNPAEDLRAYVSAVYKY